MKIIESEIKSKIRNKDIFVSNVLKRVITILKNDSSFFLKERLQKLDKIETVLNKKDKNFTSLLESSNSLKNNMIKEIELLDSSNEKLRRKLIRDLTKKDSK